MATRAKVKMSELLDALEFCDESMEACFDTQTGTIITITDEERLAADSGCDPADYPDWQRTAIEAAAALETDDAGRFIALPDRFELNEWDLMRDFALGQDEDDRRDTLLNAIHGRGAFRRFRDTIHHLGIADDWYTFRDDHYREVARQWCEENGVEVEEEEDEG